MGQTQQCIDQWVIGQWFRSTNGSPSADGSDRPMVRHQPMGQINQWVAISRPMGQINQWVAIGRWVRSTNGSPSADGSDRPMGRHRPMGQIDLWHVTFSCDLTWFTMSLKCFTAWSVISHCRLKVVYVVPWEVYT